MSSPSDAGARRDKEHAAAIASLTVERDELRIATQSHRGEVDRLRVLLDVAHDRRAKAERERNEAIRERDTARALRTAAEARIAAMYETAVEVLEKPSALLSPRDYFDHVLGTTGHAYQVEGWAETLRERDIAREDRDTLLEAITAVDAACINHHAWQAALASLRDTADEIAKRTGYTGGQDGS